MHMEGGASSFGLLNLAKQKFVQLTDVCCIKMIQYGIAFHIAVGAYQVAEPPNNGTVPGLLWLRLAVTVSIVAPNSNATFSKLVKHCTYILQ